MAFRSLFLLSCLIPLSFAALVPQPTRTQLHDAHDHPAIAARLPDTWYHREDHPAHALFRRNQSTDGSDYAPVGSPTWSAPFPSWSPDPNSLPQEWVDALNAAVSAGKIPSYAPSTLDASGNPVYPSGVDPNGPEVCSGTYKCRIPGDIWDAPDGTFGAGFDDGPLEPSPKLYDFLKSQGVHATHFMIGVNILQNANAFVQAFETNEDDIAVHTWTHPYMTTQTNLQVLGQLGWTMQLIHNSTGGRLPKYWRPPFGDSDTRVGAIAKEVFGLTTIFWNQDTEDWSIGEAGGTTSAKVNASLTKWFTGPKSPGLIILEHELSNMTVDAFITAFPLLAENNWTVTSVARITSDDVYWNVGDDGSVEQDELLAYGSFAPADSASASVATSGATHSGTASAGKATAEGAAAASSASLTGSGAHPSGTGSLTHTNGAVPFGGSGVSWWTTAGVALLWAVAAVS
ncbi:carbohydrate esterase family 4 protein [Amylocystis lapponica]|nr:carbohydrate esterase family 4 protein [Amylocystis lapponica]